MGALHWQKTKVKLFIAFSLVHSYEAGQIARPIRLSPRNEWGLSIDRKLKYTGLIGLANVDGMGSDGIGPRFEAFRISHHTQPQLLVITSTEF